jgi:hypothetical protein
VDPNNGSAFPPDPATDMRITTQYDRVISGAAFGNVRILASFDYAINANMLAGARAGYVLFTDPVTGKDPTTGSQGAAFAPLHIEARFTYLFGKDALLSQFVSPMVFGGLGVGEFDAFVPVTVQLSQPAGAPNPNPVQVTENAWLTAGPVFISAGGGVRLALTPQIAANLALKLEAAFGGTAGLLPGIAPELGMQFGL